MLGTKNEEIKPEILSFKVKVAQRVKQLRLKIGLPQDELAFDAGLHRTHIIQIENNALDLRLSTIYKIAKALDVEVAELFEFE